MISPTEIKQKAERKYAAFLSASLTGEPFFPYELPVGALPKDFIALKKAVASLIDHSKETVGYGYTLELRSRKTRSYGEQSLPEKIYIATETDYLKLLKKEQAFAQFNSDVALIRAQLPELNAWIGRHPKRVIDSAGTWEDLLKVCHYFKANPAPNLYIRELPIAVHTKFIEDNKKVLRSLLEEILPENNPIAAEGERDYAFEKRFSLRYCEPLISLRFLDPALQASYGFPVADFSLAISDFAQLPLAGARCFIVENKMPFLTLPPLENGLAIFGAGYAVGLLKSTEWLSRCPIFYWGDMDVDGFSILARLRSHFPQTQSILMDTPTYERFRPFAVTVEVRSTVTLAHLTAAEQALCDRLTQQQQRLEQERISQDYVNQCLQRLAL